MNNCSKAVFLALLIRGEFIDRDDASLIGITNLKSLVETFRIEYNLVFEFELRVKPIYNIFRFLPAYGLKRTVSNIRQAEYILLHGFRYRPAA